MLSREELDAMRDRARRWLMPDVGARDLNQDILRLLETVEEYRAALECIARRYESESPQAIRWQIAWAMHSDAESALRGKFRQPD